jgi:hypothetical protein
MKKVVVGVIVTASFLAAADRDMQRAIAWERWKDKAAAIQAQKEKRHPSVSYEANRANRSSDDEVQGRPVKDPGPKTYRDANKK